MPSGEPVLCNAARRLLWARIVVMGLAWVLAGPPVCGAQQLLSDIDPAALALPVDFNRDVRPILSDQCFVCHGRDENSRQAGLRLDQRQDAIDAGAIVAGDAAASEMVARIFSHDPDTQMPPPDSGKSLTEEQRKILVAWIQQEARYAEHWAFVPPVKAPLPTLADPLASDLAADSTASLHPIDAFVRQALSDQASVIGLRPAPPADDATLVRRMYLDLIGLPPSPAQIDQVLQDRRPDRLDRLAGGLLQSPHFGEKWARWWLDAARYSDSDGYEKDKQRTVWFYRDWVIESLNEDLPYNEFVIQQIAGDLLPAAASFRQQQAQQVATGFLRNSMVNEEGGADPEQFRVEGMFDRVDAIGKSILGITTGCAQCHTHKYDPISHQEYYAMFASLNDIHEAMITVYTPEQEQRRNEVLSNTARVYQDFKAEHPQWQQELEQWQVWSAAKSLPWRTLVPSDIPFDGQKFRVLDDGSIVGESYAPTYTSPAFGLQTELTSISAVRLDLLTHPQLPRGGPGRSIYGTGALTEFTVKVTPLATPDQTQTLKFVKAFASAAPEVVPLPAIYRERDSAADQRITGPIAFAIDGDAKTAWSTDIGPGRRNQDHYAVFLTQTPVTINGPAKIEFVLEQNHGGWNSDDNQNYLMGRYRFSITEQPFPTRLEKPEPAALTSQPPATSDLPPQPSIELLAPVETLDVTAKEFLPLRLGRYLNTPIGELTESQIAEILAFRFRSEPELAAWARRLDDAWKAYPETDTQLVVRAMEEPRTTYVLQRGDFLQPGESVPPGVPAFLGQWPDSREPARLRLARWLVRDQSPTTARAIVNRVWQSYFGQGLVATPEDFGLQSQSPSHPELLDWLAVELVESGWSLKHLHRLIVTSETYRQSSEISESQYQADPKNVWLARGPRFRVPAEVVRDTALAASGLLEPEIGGPSIYPPAPDFLFQPPTSYGPKIWQTDLDRQQYRRSLYIHAYRSVPYPSLQVFDAPKGDAACVRRERSNTPLQALVMLNEPQFVACAAAMAQRVIDEEDSVIDRQVSYAYRLASGRQPSADERKVLLQVWQQQLQHFRQHPAELRALLSSTPVTADVSQSEGALELGAMMMVCRVVLNLDETITKN